MNFKTSYMSIAQVVAVKLYINESRGWFFSLRVKLQIFFLIAIESIQFNINFESSYMSLAQVVAIKF